MRREGGTSVIARQAFRFELDPNNVQRTAIAKHAGTARFAYNWALERVKTALDSHHRTGCQDPERDRSAQRVERLQERPGPVVG
ncbi:MAG: helix-turn-helix domain-containing protein [Actinomycetota bacterium]